MEGGESGVPSITFPLPAESARALYFSQLQGFFAPAVSMLLGLSRCVSPILTCGLLCHCVLGVPSGSSRLFKGFWRRVCTHSSFHRLSSRPARGPRRRSGPSRGLGQRDVFMELHQCRRTSVPPLLVHKVTVSDLLASFPSPLEIQRHGVGSRRPRRSAAGGGAEDKPGRPQLLAPPSSPRSPGGSRLDSLGRCTSAGEWGGTSALPSPPLSRRGLPRPTRCSRRGPRPPGPNPIRYRARGCGPPAQPPPPLTGLSPAQPNGSLVSGGSADQQQSSGPHGLRSGSFVLRHKSAARSDDRGRHFVSGGRGVEKPFIQLSERDSSPRGPLVIQGSCGAVACDQPRFPSAGQRS
ncbi:hypothetical protein NDU88_006162 [Pleurodeles waltl]|uniref:Uncharacterized protein n=1 Tax=Pleurodeles waltl TaxID=8319 RepID=A0AAV7PIZ3_PLEWA|nr:hypothetical protein NDU88_006162 [Pleurodeles waltl]